MRNALRSIYRRPIRPTRQRQAEVWSSLLFSSACIVAVVLGSAAPAAAQDQSTGPNRAGSQVAELLDIGWGASFRSLEPAGKIYEQARLAAPRDPRVPYALALAQIKHRRYADAVPLVDEALSRDPRFRPAWETRIWLQTLNKQYQAAMVAGDTLAQLAAEDYDDTAESALASLAFLGRIYGFLNGPASSSVDAVTLQSQRSDVLERFPDSLQRTFLAAEASVEERYTELSLNRDQSRDTAIQTQEQQKVRDAQRLQQEREAIAAGKEEVEALASRYRQAAEAEVRALEEKLPPLEGEFRRIATQAAGVQQQINSLAVEIGRLLSAADAAQDNILAARYRADAARLDRTLDLLQMEFRRLDFVGGQVRAQIAAIEGQRQAVITRYNGEMKRLGKEATSLERSAKRVIRDEQKLIEPATGQTAAVRAASSQVNAFTTYVPYPLEKEKEQVLKSYR